MVSIYMCVFCVVLVGEKMLGINVCVLKFHFLNPTFLPCMRVGGKVQTLGRNVEHLNPFFSPLGLLSLPCMRVGEWANGFVGG